MNPAGHASRIQSQVKQGKDVYAIDYSPVVMDGGYNKSESLSSVLEELGSFVRT